MNPDSQKFINQKEILNKCLPYFLQFSFYKQKIGKNIFMASDPKSTHILSTSANLLGFCLIVVTSLHIGTKLETTYADEFATSVALLLAVSTLLSYLSLKFSEKNFSQTLEKIADFFFVLALLGIIVMISILLITYSSKI